MNNASGVHSLVKERKITLIRQKVIMGLRVVLRRYFVKKEKLLASGHEEMYSFQIITYWVSIGLYF